MLRACWTVLFTLFTCMSFAFSVTLYDENELELVHNVKKVLQNASRPDNPIDLCHVTGYNISSAAEHYHIAVNATVSQAGRNCSLQATINFTLVAPEEIQSFQVSLAPLPAKSLSRIEVRDYLATVLADNPISPNQTWVICSVQNFDFAHQSEYYFEVNANITVIVWPDQENCDESLPVWAWFGVDDVTLDAEGLVSKYQLKINGKHSTIKLPDQISSDPM